MNLSVIKENFIYNDFKYPVSACEFNNSMHKTLMDCHWHEELEFFILTEGKVSFQVDSDYFEVNQGQAVFINSGKIHSCCHLNSLRCSYLVIVFDISLLKSNTYDLVQEKYIDSITKKSHVFPTHIKGVNDWETNVISLLTKIIDVNLKKAPAYELYTKALLYIIISELYNNKLPAANTSRNEENNYKTERLKTVLNYIHANYCNPIKLRDLTDLINMSEGYFCRFFKQMMHKTPIEYINCYRTHKAAKLLESTDKKILEISLDVGFESISNFINTFKQYMSCTPSIYREQFNKIKY